MSANAGAFLMNATLAAQTPGLASDSRRAMLAWTRLVSEDDVARFAAAGLLTEATSGALTAAAATFALEEVGARIETAMRAGVGAMRSPTVLFSSLPRAAVDAAIQARVADLTQALGSARGRALSTLIRQGVAQRAGSRTLAAMLAEAVGLTSGQTRSLALLQAALAEAEMSDAGQARVIARRAAQMRRTRAATIARTEIATAYNRGTQLAVEAVVGDNTAGARKTWRTQADERVCPVCGPLDGVEVGLLESFPGVGDLPPAHVNCRCVVTYEIDP